MTDKLKCPKCGSLIIEEDDCYDTMNSFSTVKEYYCGHCQKCGAELQWAMVYIFIGYDEIEEG